MVIEFLSFAHYLDCYVSTLDMTILKSLVRREDHLKNELPRFLALMWIEASDLMHTCIAITLCLNGIQLLF